MFLLNIKFLLKWVPFASAAWCVIYLKMNKKEERKRKIPSQNPVDKREYLPCFLNALIEIKTRAISHTYFSFTRNNFKTIISNINECRDGFFVK